MKYSVRFSPFAKEDKGDIIAYLSKFYPETPNRFKALLKEYITKLKENPYQYSIYQDNPEYRHALVGNYFIFYKINEEKKQISIYRILRASWDIPNYL